MVYKKAIFNGVKRFEKKYSKLIYYSGLLFLTITSYSLRHELTATKIEMAIIKERNQLLISNMVIYNRSFETFPLEVWQKVKRGNKFIMQYVNPQYVKSFGHLFGENQFNIIGNTNFDMFPYKDAQRYYENDLVVSITGNPLKTTEYSTDEKGNRIELKVSKWRDIKDDKDTLIYGIVREIKKYN